MTEARSTFVPAAIPDGRREIDGNIYIGDGKGGWQPVETVKPQTLLEDELVRMIMGFWIAASEQMARLKVHTIEDIDDFRDLLAQEYDSSLGGKKGNLTLRTHDGRYKVEVRINDFVDFGPELQVAKTLVDECLNEWSASAGAELRAIVTNAFNTEQAGKVNRNELIKLTKLSIDDERWQRAMQAIHDAQRVIGSKQYVRAYQRERFDAAWEAVTTDMAKA